VLEKSLLGASTDKIFGELNKLLEIVDRFKYSQNAINSELQDHLSRREELGWQAKEEPSRNRGRSDFDDALMDEEFESIDHKVWQEKLLDSYNKANKRIDNIWADFKVTLYGFLDMIDTNTHLKELSFMLDFNEYYKIHNRRVRPRINFDDTMAGRRDPTPENGGDRSSQNKVTLKPGSLMGNKDLPAMYKNLKPGMTQGNKLDSNFLGLKFLKITPLQIFQRETRRGLMGRGILLMLEWRGRGEWTRNRRVASRV
jgi:hypothetical protein